MKMSKSFANVLSLALVLTALAVSSVFSTRSTAERVSNPMSNKPIVGIDVVVLKSSGNSASHSFQTDAEGGLQNKGIFAYRAANRP